MSATPEAVVEKEIVNNRALITIAHRNYGTLLRQIDTLTHEDSRLQPPFRGNCLNWVMGHIVQSRDRMLRVVGEATVWTPEQVARYERNSPPVLAEGAMSCVWKKWWRIWEHRTNDWSPVWKVLHRMIWM